MKYMEKMKLSWQGVGMSTNPYQKKEPLSAHLLAYLKKGSESSEEHAIIVADSMQVSNYMRLHNLNEKKARKIALSKGRRKTRDLEKICQANGLNNVKIFRFNDIWKQNQEQAYNKILNIYNNDSEIKEKVDSIVPERIKKKIKNHKSLAEYTLKEIALILTVPGAKIGHEREITYDKVASLIHQRYNVGNKPEFHYPEIGLEYVPGRDTEVEPYSSFVSDRRILLTDSRKEFLRKIRGLPKKALEKLKTQINEVWGIDNGNFAEEFYNTAIAPTHSRFQRPKRRLTMAASIALALITFGGVGASYVHADAKQIRQKQINQIPGFAFSGDVDTSRKAVKEKIQQANEIIHEKYKIRDYFDN